MDIDSSSDIPHCFLRGGSPYGVILDHHDDGKITSEGCSLEKCKYFFQCEISKNPFVVKALSDSKEHS